MTKAATKKVSAALGGDNFDRFAADWWNPKGKLKSLHEITPLRFSYFLDKATETIGSIKGKRVLDIGCGGGLLSERFAVEGAIVTGIDLSGKMIEVARAHAKETNGACGKIDYQRISIGEFLIKNKKPFDVVVCSEVLEHVDDLKGFLEEACRALAPGGPFFFSTINKTLKARIFAIFVAENLLGMLPTGTHDFDKFIRPSLLVKLFKENSITVEELKGLVFSPVSLGFKVSGDTSVNYMGYGVKAREER